MSRPPSLYFRWRKYEYIPLMLYASTSAWYVRARLAENDLYFGDNLDVLRRHIADESVDLVYLDPPFNSNADYNVLFAEQDGTRAAAQIKAFKDTWRWDQAAVQAYEETVERGGKVGDVM